MTEDNEKDNFQIIMEKVATKNDGSKRNKNRFPKFLCISTFIYLCLCYIAIIIFK